MTSNLPRLEDLDGLHIRFLAPAAGIARPSGRRTSRSVSVNNADTGSLPCRSVILAAEIAARRPPVWEAVHAANPYRTGVVKLLAVDFPAHEVQFFPHSHLLLLALGQPAQRPHQ